MKIFFFSLLLLFIRFKTAAQSISPDEGIQRNLEELATRYDAPSEDDSYWQALEHLSRHPLDLNQAGEAELASFPFLSPVQINSFITYRALLGKLLTLYELQAIPGWDPETIRKLKAFVFIEKEGFTSVSLGHQISEGEGNFLLRYSRVLEQSKGYEKSPEPGASHFLGSPDKVFFRYNFSNKKILQLGLLGEKDAGEPFFGKYQPYGFDFYSFHCQLGQWGIIKNLFIGDFTVNQGQGLIQWQSLAFGKGGNVIDIKRQSPTIRPYGSAGEFNFQRGIGITVSMRRWEATAFLSNRKLDANLEPDSLIREDHISSFETGGLHRTFSELSDKNSIQQWSTGFSLGYRAAGFYLGLNGIGYQFSRKLLPSDLPYNLFAIRGRNWVNASLDFAFTLKGKHGFGEMALDKLNHKALVLGLLVSLGRNAGLSLLYRNIAAGYQAMNGNAFTENTKPSNENGFYAGLALRPRSDWQIDLFFDFYQFPWLRYRADGPGYGKEFLIQAKYSPVKSWSLYTRFRGESKLVNGDQPSRGNYLQAQQAKLDWRSDLALNLAKAFELRTRTELLWLRNGAGTNEKGFLSMIDVHFHPQGSYLSGNLAIQYFETTGYNSRIYVYESDGLFGLNLPSYYDTGYHYYLNLRIRLNQLFRSLKRQKPEVDLWLRWSQGIYEKKDKIGTGPDEIPGPIKSEWKLEFFFNW